MASGRSLGAGNIASENEAEDLLVLGPDQRALLGIVEHGAHRAFQMRPLRRDGVFDRAVAGQTIERHVKGYVGLDERQHWRIRTQCEAGGKRPDLEAVRHLRRVMTPWLGSRNPDRRNQVLMDGWQDGIGTDLSSRVATSIVTARQSECSDRGDDSSDARLGDVNRFENAGHWRAP